MGLARLIVVVGAALLVGACSGETADPTTTTQPTASSVTATIEEAATASTVPQRGLVPVCDPGVWREAPDDWYRDDPVYVETDDLRAAVRRYANSLDGYQTTWGNRARNNWIHVGFVGTDIIQQQRDLEEAFPGEGIVAIDLEHTTGDLNAMAEELADELPDGMVAYQADVKAGTISIWVGKVTDQDRALLHSLSGQYPLCVDGLVGEQIGEAGPQQPSGAGWRYLAEAATGIGRVARIITSDDTLDALWDELKLETVAPEIEWANEIVVAFEIGHGGGSGCGETRFDGVSIDGDVVQAVIVNPALLEGPPEACFTIYIGHVYVVAVDRDVLPPAPFTVKTVPNSLWEASVTSDLREPDSTIEPAP